jgi:outer membrane lipopolysaccharide assembly protein LptE/RlpB
MAKDTQSNSEQTRAGDSTGPLLASKGISAPVSQTGPKTRRSRRFGFVVLLFLVVVGMVVSAMLLHRRFQTALDDIALLETRLEGTESELGRAVTDIENLGDEEDILRQDLDDLSIDVDAKLRASQNHTTHLFLLYQAQTQTTKSLLSLMKDDIGQARQEVGNLQVTLTTSVSFANDQDARVLTDLVTRAGRVTEDLDKNAFAAQQTLEVIWRELDELIVELLVE